MVYITDLRVKSHVDKKDAVEKLMAKLNEEEVELLADEESKGLYILDLNSNKRFLKCFMGRCSHGEYFGCGFD